MTTDLQTDPLTAVVARATELYEDVELQSVRDWKARGEGRKAIGFLPIYVPREVIHAAGALPVGIMGGGDQLEIVRGDSYFQSYICHLPRSVIEMAVSGRLDALDGFLFPSICDVIRNLSGMFQMLKGQKYVHYLDLPQNFDPELGGRFYRHELRTVADAIGRITGTAVNDERLRRSIRTYNVNRAAIRELLALRIEQPWLVPTTEYYVMLRAGYLLPPDEHTSLLHEYLEHARSSNRRPLDNIRVLVRGAFCEQPPLALLRTIERAGCYVVDDDFVLGSRFIPDAIDETGDPWEALSQAFLKHSLPTASKYDEANNAADLLVQRVRDVRADGVLLMAPSFCDPALLDQPMLAGALDKADIPFTSFKYSEDTGQFQVIREQAGTFADAIKLWGKA
ncbi:MAG: benzoyl-CoA reductase subunit C [Planctomycetes bacterium]|nr:benzoyl-CoA reductase subunit C [Planctomycetota bacterium]MCW8135990.1 benzoyl-CoA reductase subunit C [Planctomycetota bacterium]